MQQIFSIDIESNRSFSAEEIEDALRFICPISEFMVKEEVAQLMLNSDSAICRCENRSSGKLVHFCDDCKLPTRRAG